MAGQKRRVKALSIRQPWAWAVIYGGKDIENRPAGAVKMMAHTVGRRIFIHAAKSRLDLESGLHSLRTRGLKPPQPKAFPLGGVIGSVMLAAIVQRSRSTGSAGHTACCSKTHVLARSSRSVASWAFSLSRRRTGLFPELSFCRLRRERRQ